MGAHTINWRAPWRAIEFAAEIPGVQRQLDRELTSAHPLSGRKAEVIGRRIDCDDVVALLSDGTYVNVHLVWGKTGDEKGEFPSWFPYGTREAFLRAMEEDALEYGDES